MPITWTISIDWDRNGDFAGTYENVTARVIQCNWFLGMRKPYQEAADNSLMTIVLNNADKLYSPDAAGDLFGTAAPMRASPGGSSRSSIKTSVNISTRS